MSNDLTVRRGYCDEHLTTDHFVDERGRCHGESLRAIEARGYTWARHIGGGWYQLHERHPEPLPLQWQILADAHDNKEIESDF